MACLPEQQEKPRPQDKCKLGGTTRNTEWDLRERAIRCWLRPTRPVAVVKASGFASNVPWHAGRKQRGGPAGVRHSMMLHRTDRQ